MRTDHKAHLWLPALWELSSLHCEGQRHSMTSNPPTAPAANQAVQTAPPRPNAPSLGCFSMVAGLAAFSLRVHISWRSLLLLL
ncbi:hypothetical protein CgunFtcFv8_012650 [Champsocephalus gunnari]|uniref:Uncharacterized protein n=1 Tax=Champsocephalus gunnari TaxID=52237 RepID=A0AAN8HSW5_CHAGU|nr:hypothetical protein CgunFtcFv8_012650 [Champsocephalus gunnari]